MALSDDVVAKIVCMIVLFVVSTVLGLIPLFFDPARLAKESRRFTVQSCLLCYGAGVLFSTCIVHIMPEVQKRLFFQF